MADRRSRAAFDRLTDYDTEASRARQAGAGWAPGELDPFYPGEPIVAPPTRRGASMGSALLVVLGLGAGGWGLVSTEAAWRPLVMPLVETVLAEMARIGEPAPAPAAMATGSLQQQAAHAAPLPEKEVAAAPDIVTGTPVAAQPEPPPQPVEEQTGAERQPADAAPATAETEAAGEAGPLPPPRVDPADPYQKRAFAVGLHPELSRALLSRLSDADYRNAGIAIGKAVAETADTDKLVWPTQRAPRLALFHVHFVPGAAPDCRRYVVTVTKDGWSTTAQPMERCGVKRPARKSS